MSLYDDFMKVDIQPNVKKSKSKPKQRQSKQTIKSDLSSVVSSNSTLSVDEEWKQTPYNLNGEIVYVVIVDMNGRFVRPFKPSDFGCLRKRTCGLHKWMLSSPKHMKNVYAVVVDSFGTIIDGVFHS